MGDGRILLKPRRDDSFKKVLSNEPNFGRTISLGDSAFNVQYKPFFLDRTYYSSITVLEINRP